MKLRILLIACLVGSSCGKDVNPDHGEPALQSNYPSAEFYACGQRFVGLGQCRLEIGKDISDIKLRIQTFYKGRIRVFSEALPADVSIEYSGEMRLDPHLHGKPEESVLIGFVINPEYPGERDQVISVHGAIGFLAVNVARPGDEIEFHATKAPMGSGGFIDVDVSDAEALIVVSPSCGIDKAIDVRGLHLFRLELRDYIDVNAMRRCIIDMAVIGERSRLVNWLAWVYSDSFTPLSIPHVSVRDREIEIKAESSVAVLSVDSVWKVGNEAQFDFDESKAHVVRAMTVKGRLVVGEWIPEKRGFKWKT